MHVSVSPPLQGIANLLPPKKTHYPQIQGDVYPKAPKPPTQWRLGRIFQLQPKPWLHRSSVTTVSDVAG